MDERKRTRTSKFLSLVLRHRPEAVGVELDACGWVDVATLLAACTRHGTKITPEELDEVVTTNAKQRFAFSDDRRRIRANQGHSVDVDLGYEPAVPPEQLFHGTVAVALAAIRATGLAKMRRHHVHLSPDRGTASTVGQRRGKPVILVVRSAQMAHAGFEFFVAANGVWLTEHVPAAFIEFPE